MHRQAACVVVIKQDGRCKAMLAITNTGSQFSLLSNGFADAIGIRCNTCETGDEFRLLDMSGSKLHLIGYANVELSTVSSDAFHGTRMLVIEGEGHEVLMGRMDLCVLDIISSNFPLRMSQIAIEMERKVRGRTLMTRTCPTTLRPWL